MLDSLNFVAVLFLHLIICAIIFICVHIRLLKASRQMMPVVILVPFWGAVCVLLLHIMHVAGLEGQADTGVEKLHTNEDVYRSLIVEDLNMQKSVVPLQEALLLNDAKMRRGMMLDVLYENPDDYFELLDEARANEDGEVVHYATTALAELNKEYDFRLQKLERAYAEKPMDPDILYEYCEFLRQYLERGLVQGQMERVQRRQYANLLMKLVAIKPSVLRFEQLAQTQMELGEYGLAGETLDQMQRRYPDNEKTLMLRLEYAVQQKDGDTVTALLHRVEDQGMYLSAPAKDRINFFRENRADMPKRRKGHYEAQAL